LILKRASASRPSGEWTDDDYDVLADGAIVGRIMKAAAVPVGMSVSIRQELAAAVAAMRMRGSRRLSRTTLWPNPTSQTAPS